MFGLLLLFFLNQASINHICWFCSKMYQVGKELLRWICSYIFPGCLSSRVIASDAKEGLIVFQETTWTQVRQVSSKCFNQISVFSHTGCLPQRIMERANHINIAMVDDIDSNGTGRSKVDTAVERNKQPCGSTVSFHHIQYKVKMNGGIFCKRKTSPKEILVDLKLVLKIVHPLPDSFLLKLYLAHSLRASTKML